VTIAMGWIIAKERLTVVQGAGVAVALIGVALVSL